MKLLSPPKLSPEEKCPYIATELARHEFFLAHDLSAQEFDDVLKKGFRKFGVYFFRPHCQNCQACRPLRVNVNDFKPSKSHRRVLKKNQDVAVSFQAPEYSEEIFQLFRKHSKIRFDQEENHNTAREDFIQTHFTQTTPTVLSLFHLQDQLIAVGFLDLSQWGTSSVYFIYDPDYGKRSLGVFGALKEIEYTQKTKRDYYYLGYYIKENPSMNYKNQFHPYELFDWTQGIWKEIPR